MAIAKVFAATRWEDNWAALREGIADVFEADNDNFDRKRFYDACEPREVEV